MRLSVDQRQTREHTFRQKKHEILKIDSGLGSLSLESLPSLGEKNDLQQSKVYPHASDPIIASSGSVSG